MRRWTAAGRLKMRGRKTLRARCGCCVLENRKEAYFTSLIKRDLHRAKLTFG